MAMDERRGGNGIIFRAGEILKEKVVNIARDTKKVAQDDPRRIVHSLKVGLALTIVSIFYYYQPLYNNFGVSAMWAIMTVVVVFEFSVGATLGKGLNRGLATLVAGGLGIGAHHLGSLSGHIFEPMLLGFFVFLLASLSTFMRFLPKVKAKYEYGMVVFILTFSLVSVSGFRDDEIFELTHKRISTIVIGASACIIISIMVCPVWAGEDLHNLIALNLDKLGNFLEGFGEEYSKAGEETDSKSKDEKKRFLTEYKSVLNSKNLEESLANFARWEPGHGRLQFRHPWKQYLKVGSLIRECAYKLEALNGYLNSEIQVSTKLRSKIEKVCTNLSIECGRGLKELALALKTMTQPNSADSNIENAKSAAKTLNGLLKSRLLEEEEEEEEEEDGIDLIQIIPLCTVASLLIEVLNCTQQIAESVHEVASKAHFANVDTDFSAKTSVLGRQDQIKPKLGQKIGDTPHVVININESIVPKEKILEDKTY